LGLEGFGHQFGIATPVGENVRIAKRGEHRQQEPDLWSAREEERQIAAIRLPSSRLCPHCWRSGSRESDIGC
jgi:hypothetical protein